MSRHSNDPPTQNGLWRRVWARLGRYADHFTEDFDTLLRYADHALYRSKAHKHERSRYLELFTLEEKHDNTDQTKQNASQTHNRSRHIVTVTVISKTPGLVIRTSTQH
jgi:hypothetical protein